MCDQCSVVWYGDKQSKVWSGEQKCSEKTVYVKLTKWAWKEHGKERMEFLKVDHLYRGMVGGWYQYSNDCGVMRYRFCDESA